MSSGVAYYGGPWSQGRPPLPDQVTPRHLDLMFFGVVSLNRAVLTILRECPFNGVTAV